MNAAHEDEVEGGVQANGVRDHGLGNASQVDTANQETEGNGGDADRLVATKIPHIRIFFDSFESLLLVHQLLNFCFLQGLPVIDPGDKVQTLGSLGGSALPQQVSGSVFEENTAQQEEESERKKREI